MRRAIPWLVPVLLAASFPPAFARSPGEPVQLAWAEGDIGGVASIWSQEGDRVLGFVEYRQVRRKDLLETVRVARFRDGSSDEDRAVARVGDSLRAIEGRSIIKNGRGEPIVDMSIDVRGHRLHGWFLDDGKRRSFDETVDLTEGTYWGPLVFIVLKNFERNAEDGRLVFRTVVPTPAPRVIDLEFVRREPSVVELRGGELDAVRFSLRPTVHWAVDPLVRLVAPSTEFFVSPGKPPALARFAGPRNFAGERIRVE